MDTNLQDYNQKLIQKCTIDKFYSNRILSLLEPLLINMKIFKPENKFLSMGVFLGILDSMKCMLIHNHNSLKEALENTYKDNREEYDNLKEIEKGYEQLFKVIKYTEERAEDGYVDPVTRLACILDELQV